MKKSLVILMAVLLVGAFIGMAQSAVPHPNTIVDETVGTIATLDPAWCYDTSSGEAIWQVYDNLIQYDGPSIKKFLPMLSTNVPSVKDGTILNNGKTYIFHIRQGVYFHNGDILTPQDVVYSLERVVIFDRAGGPQWMLSEALLPEINGNYVDDITQWAVKLAGVKSFSDLFTKGTKTPKNAKYRQALIDTFKLLSKAFEIKGNTVIINLPHPYPPILFILAHGASWAAILDQKWAVAHGAWPGTADTWWKYNNPTREKDPLYDITNGTGPFILERWTKARETVFKRFDKYWAGPAKIKYGIIKLVNEFTTRKLDLLRGRADMIYVPISLIKQVKGVKGVSVTPGKGFPTLSLNQFVFTWNVAAKGNPYIGSGKLDGNGIPPDFFSNLDVRKAFEYLFPYKIYINQVLLGHGITPNSAIPQGMLGYNPTVPPAYHQDLAKAKYYFKKAYNGELWKKGFKFTVVYTTGVPAWQTACEMLKAYARKLNPKFRINVASELWATFLSDYETGKLPMFTIGWLADYPGPYDFAQPYYSSAGAYGASIGASYTKWAKVHMDPLVNASMKTAVPQKRAAIFEKLNVLAHNEALYLWLSQPFVVHVQRTWVKGWYYNAMRPGIDFYSLSK